MDFAGPGELLTFSVGEQGGKPGQYLLIWDVETGKLLRQFENNHLNASAGRYEVSPGGAFLATIHNVAVEIIDLKTGQVSGTIKSAKSSERGKNVVLDSFCFSSDGTEIATLCEGSQGGLITVYDMETGDVKLSHELSVGQKKSRQNHWQSYKGPHLQMIANPAGFLMFGSSFIERESGFLIWQFEQSPQEYNNWQRLLTRSGLIGLSAERTPSKLQVLPFPSEKLMQALAAYQGDANALVKLGAKVAVDVEVGEVLFGKSEDVKQKIEKLIAGRLAEDGLEVGDDAATVLKARYTETVAQASPEIKKIFPENRVALTLGQLTIVWTSKDAKRSIYESVFNFDPYFQDYEEVDILGKQASSAVNLRMKGQLTETTSQQMVFEALELRLAAARMPYFVPIDKSLLSLPAITKSASAATVPSPNSGKSKMDSKKKKSVKR